MSSLINNTDPPNANAPLPMRPFLELSPRMQNTITRGGFCCRILLGLPGPERKKGGKKLAVGGKHGVGREREGPKEAPERPARLGPPQTRVPQCNTLPPNAPSSVGRMRRECLSRVGGARGRGLHLYHLVPLYPLSSLLLSSPDLKGRYQAEKAGQPLPYVPIASAARAPAPSSVGEASPDLRSANSIRIDFIQERRYEKEQAQRA
ncbi:hypothetical protein Tco_0580660 [Tanacetum coccineum]